MKHSRLEQLLVGVLLVIAGGVVLHAPMSVWLGAIWPQYVDYIKSWKELLMGVAFVALLVQTARHQAFKNLLGDRLIQLSLGYAGLHLLMMVIFRNDPVATSAGLLIDLRYVFYFALAYATALLFPQYRRVFIWTFVVGAVVVLGFALLQVFVLPKDILAQIGYSKQTIAPYLTVDENPAFIRINSTLRGPNPLGAYVVIVVALLTAISVRWRSMNKKGWIMLVVSALAALITLYASYSRSAGIGALVAVATVVLVGAGAKYRNVLIVGVFVACALLGGGVYALRNEPFIASVVLHNSPTTGAAVDSNAGHLESLADGTNRLIAQPFGAGVGSTGSASLDTDKPLIIENQYLLVAHEVGWAGLFVFVWLFAEIMRRLYALRKSVLALGLFGSGAGLAVIGLLLPVWTDDTVSILWWGLAGLATSQWNAKESKKDRTRKKK